MHESRHHLLEFFLAHLAVPHADAGFGSDFLHEIRQRVDRLDPVVHHVHLTASIEFKVDRIFDELRV